MLIEKKPGKMFMIMMHALAWIMIFISPLLMIPWEFSSRWLDFYWRFLINQSVILGLFYLNYFLLINKFLFTKQVSRFIGYNLLLILLMTATIFLLDQVIFPVRFEGDHPGHGMKYGWIIGRLFRDITMDILSVGLSVAIRMTGYWYDADARRKELERVHAEAELKNLKSQLNPHFLFNTLNNIYALIAISEEKAQSAVHQLSKLLRYVLYENNSQEVPLAQELEFIRNYLDLVRLRYSSKVKIEFTVTGDFEQKKVAPLLFVSLIENAFKHGISTQHPSYVIIHFDLSDPDRVLFTTSNSFFPKDETDRSGSGIGLENLRRRLSLLYPGRYTFTAARQEDHFDTSLSVRTNEK